MEGFPEKLVDKQLQFTNPATAEVFGSTEVTMPQAIAAKGVTAREAQKRWAGTPVGDRIPIMRRIRQRFAAEAQHIVDTLGKEIGRPEAESWFSEVVPNIELFDYWNKNIIKYLAPEKLPLSPINYPGKKGWIEWSPRGVIGLITPWNFPVSIPIRALVPALLAGNAVLWKPSEWSAAAGQLVAEIFNSELPEGVLQVAQGLGDTGAAVVDAVDMVVFTGSVATGRKIAVRCAERGIPCGTELGGKDAAYVASDAQLDRAVAGLVWGAMMNCGQNCASVERIYVEQSLYETFVTRYQAEMEKLPGQVGPVINPMQARKISEQVEAAIAAGAQVPVGGEGEKLFIEPTLVLGAREDMPVVAEETFGPVVPIMPVSGWEEARDRINASSYALTTSIWTSDYVFARRAAAELDSGVVTVNNHGFTAAIPSAPWVGTRDSGTGVTNSHIALHEMVRPRFYLEDHNKAERELWWYPYTQTAVELARTLVATMRPGGNKVGQYIKLIGLMRKRWLP